MDEVKEKKILGKRLCTMSQSSKAKDEKLANVKKVREVTAILQKPEIHRTKEETDMISSNGDIVKEVHLRQANREKLKARTEEFEDSLETIEEKCIRLAAAISQANSFVVYTGAGISTAASIPDYRGTNGVWTMLQQGREIGKHDLTQAEPTITHMALYSLYKSGILKHIVSQNCDGLHLRSGIPKNLLSEVHGNMYVEVCRTCKPFREYWRLFDVTEKTARYSHNTGRLCHKCSSALQDSIVHFGERGNLPWPINWNGASKAAKQADVILCLGSSLKVLKSYPWLWQMDKPVSKRAQVYIVNLQWTPKDKSAALKINGKCDDVMRIVMSHLGLDIPTYDRAKDPIFYHAIKLESSEQPTTSNPCLQEPTVSQETVKLENSENMIECGIQCEESDIIQDMELMEEEEVEDEEEEEEEEEDDEVQIVEVPGHPPNNQDSHPAPYFAALPFLAMGLPMPPIYIYPQLEKFLYYPIMEVSDDIEDSDPCKYEPECDFCVENEGSLCCLYYKRDSNIFDSSDLTFEENQESEKLDEDENASVTATKNPGWFGKGYRKGIKKKR